MSGLDNRRVALVVASSDGQDEVATGYFLTSDLVLTARHVVLTPGAKIAVRVALDGLSDEDRWTDASIEWSGAGDLDAVLLRTEKSFTDDWTLPTIGESVEAGTWHSNGYARLAADDDSGNRKTQPVSGTYGVSGGQGPAELALQTNQNISPKWDTYWKGISGAPVFSESNGELIGIIVDANSAMSNALIGLPIQRVLSDINFQLAVTPSFLGYIPRIPWCLVLTTEESGGHLIAEVGGVLSGFRDEDVHFTKLHETPVELPVLRAIETPENWARAVGAIAKADFLVADVTHFEPAVMLLLGVRAVLRRGVTVSVTRESMPSHAAATPFNVRETRVLSYQNNPDFYDDLHRAMLDGIISREQDPNYLDLPAYHAVRTPRPETLSEEDSRSALVLCSFSERYTQFFVTLRPILRAHTRNLMPRRMMDLRSPRLVGQALYQDIRWARRCVVDWSEWRPNVFFEFGVRLACSDQDPFCIIERDELVGVRRPGARPARQQRLLSQLFAPQVYDRADPRAELKAPLELWRNSLAGSGWQMPGALLPATATFRVAQANYVWSDDEMLLLPHVEQRTGAERILGSDQQRRPERMVLYSANEAFYAQLLDSVREKWIASWLYLSHRVLSTEEGQRDEDMSLQLRTIGQFTRQALSTSNERRHAALRAQIDDYIRSERSRRRARRSLDAGD